MLTDTPPTRVEIDSDAAMAQRQNDVARDPAGIAAASSSYSAYKIYLMTDAKTPDQGEAIRR